MVIRLHTPTKASMCGRESMHHGSLTKYSWEHLLSPPSGTATVCGCCSVAEYRAYTHSSRSWSQHHERKSVLGLTRGGGHCFSPTVLIFLGSGTGVSGSVGVRSLESSDACFWMASLACTFGERSPVCDFCVTSEGGCTLDEISLAWDFAIRSPSCGLGGRSFICGLGGKSESCGLGGRSPNWGLGGSSPGLGGNSPIWGLGASSMGFGGRSPGGGFWGNSAICDDF